jgi:hypothetical protein
MADISTQRNGLRVSEALNLLPLETPDASTWPIIASQIHALKPPSRTERPRRWQFFASAACLCVLFAGIIYFNGNRTVTALPTDSQLASLMQQSSQLETLLLAMRNPVSNNAVNEAWQLSFDEQLQTIDQQLYLDTLSQAQQVALWQQRINILQQANSLGIRQRLQAADGSTYRVALVESY